MPENSVPENLDAVLRKYGRIWIWSILLAAVAGLSVRVFAGAGILTLPGIIGQFRMANSPWSPLVMLLAYLPSLGTLAAVWLLLQFLRYHIVPILFPPPPAAPAPPAHVPAGFFTLTGQAAEIPSAPMPAEEEAARDGGKLLYGAFAAIVAVVTLDVLVGLGSILYRALAG